MHRPFRPARRALLGRAALAAAGLALAPSAALAFRLESADDYRGLVDNACGAETETHRALLAEVEQQLGMKLSEEEAQEIIGQLSCPSCGCTLLAAYQGGLTAPASPF